MRSEHAKVLSPDFEIRVVPDDAERSVPWTDKAWLGIFLVAIVGVSTLFLSKQSLRLDEAQSIWQSSRTPQGVLYVIAQDVHVPLYGLMLHFWIFIFGQSVPILRSMSLLFFLASIPAAYALGKLSFSRTHGLLAAAFLSASPFLNWYGNEIRMYSILVFLAILSHYFFLSIYKKWRQTSHWVLTRWWLGYLVTAFLGIYTHYLFWFILTAQAVFYFFYSAKFPPGTFWKLSGIALFLVTTLAPWVYYVFKIVNMISNSEPMLAKPHIIDLFNTFSQFFFGFQDDHLNTLIISLWPLAVVMAFLSLRKRVRIPDESAYFLISTFFPILTIFAISLVLRPLFLSRYLIFSTPTLYLLLVWLIMTYPPKLRNVSIAVFLSSMMAMLTVQIYQPDTPVKEDYHDVSAYLTQTTNPQDIVIVSSPFTIYPLEYYYNGGSSVTTLPVWNRYITGPIPQFTQNELASDTTMVANGHDKAFLVLSYDQGYEKNIKNYFDQHFPLLQQVNFSPGLNLYVYNLQRQFSKNNGN